MNNVIKKIIYNSKKIFRDVLINGILASYLIPFKLRTICMKLYGIKIDKTSRVAAKCFFGRK